MPQIDRGEKIYTKYLLNDCSKVKPNELSKYA
jgi:hypothetical protein